jgi:hypothetical protein
MKTWVSIALNVGVAAIGVLQATNWVDLVGSNSAGLVATGIAVVNMLLHYFAGGAAAVPPAGGPVAPAAK